MVFGLHIPGTGRLEAKGIPVGATANTQEFFPNALGALKRQLDPQPPGWVEQQRSSLNRSVLNAAPARCLLISTKRYANCVMNSVRC